MLRKHVLVVGDSMLDVDVTGPANRICPEAPVPIFKEQHISYKLGGAAKLAEYMIGQGIMVSLASCSGLDPARELLSKMIIERGIDYIEVVEPNRPTTTKTRYWDSMSNQLLLRIDNESTTPLLGPEHERFLNNIRTTLFDSSIDGVVFCDYEKGVLNKKTIYDIKDMLIKQKIPVFVDPKDQNIESYTWEPNQIIKMNWKEFINYYPTAISGMELGAKLKTAQISLNCDWLVITRGENSTLAISKRDEFTTEQVQPIYSANTVGAGDIYMGSLVLSYLRGESLKSALKLANEDLKPYLLRGRNGKTINQT